jgi:hypothetical protein
MSDTFYMIVVVSTRDPKAPQKERIAAMVEQKRRTKAVHEFLKARGHSYMRRANAFATREEAEQAVLQMGFPYKIDICPASWVF